MQSDDLLSLADDSDDLTGVVRAVNRADTAEEVADDVSAATTLTGPPTGPHDRSVDEAVDEVPEAPDSTPRTKRRTTADRASRRPSRPRSASAARPSRERPELGRDHARQAQGRLTDRQTRLQKSGRGPFLPSSFQVLHSRLHVGLTELVALVRGAGDHEVADVRQRDRDDDDGDHEGVRELAEHPAPGSEADKDHADDGQHGEEVARVALAEVRAAERLARSRRRRDPAADSFTTDPPLVRDEQPSTHGAQGREQCEDGRQEPAAGQRERLVLEVLRGSRPS
jgi:hypothetical protein